MPDLRKFGILLLVCTLTALVSPGSSIVNPRPKPTYTPDFVFPSVPEDDSRRLPVWELSLFDHSIGFSNQRSERLMQPTSSVYRLENTDRASVEAMPRAARAKITPILPKTIPEEQPAGCGTQYLNYESLGMFLN